MKIEFEWQKLDETTRRAKVIGGWIVHCCDIFQNTGISEALVFVPDADHLWEVTLPVIKSDS